MNVTECCRTIGCNCAGTVYIEMMSMPAWKWIILLLTCAVTLLLLIPYLIERKMKK